MTEQQAYMLAAELNQHQWWRVSKVCYNADKRAPGWEVWLEHRTWPTCGEGHCFQDYPVKDAAFVPAALREDGERIEAWRQGFGR